MEDTQKHYTGEFKKARQSSSKGLIIRQKEPTNLETPFDQVDSFLTPAEMFYIRSHFPTPKLDLASYQLRIDGAVRNPFSLSYKELRDMPSETRVATLECTGNGRVFLIPQVEGAQWELGAVGNAEWTGVPLGALLERAGMEEDACEIAVSTDGGQTWSEAEFLDPVQRHAWRRWKFEWLTPKKPGQHTLLARAKDVKGGLQPDKHDQNYGTYVINHPLPIEVFVAPKNDN